MYITSKKRQEKKAVSRTRGEVFSGTSYIDDIIVIIVILDSQTQTHKEDDEDENAVVKSYF